MTALNLFKSKPYSRNPFKKIKYFIYSLKYAYQRATQGFSDYDLYDLGYFYADLFQASIQAFIKGGVVCTPLRPNMTEEEWIAILTEMYTYFYNSNEDNEVYKKSL